MHRPRSLSAIQSVIQTVWCIICDLSLSSSQNVSMDFIEWSRRMKSHMINGIVAITMTLRSYKNQYKNCKKNRHKSRLTCYTVCVCVTEMLFTKHSRLLPCDLSTENCSTQTRWHIPSNLPTPVHPDGNTVVLCNRRQCEHIDTLYIVLLFLF